MLNAFTRDGRQLARQIMDQYPDNQQMDSALSGYQPVAGMGAYVTNAALAGELTAYATVADLAPFVTATELSGTLAAYATTTALDAALVPYLTQASAETTYSPKNRVVQYETPGVGDTVVVNSDTDYLILDPAGPLANVTLDFPTEPADQKRFTVASTRNMNSLSINTGTKTIKNAVNNMSGGGAFEYMFRGNSNAWFRVK